MRKGKVGTVPSARGVLLERRATSEKYSHLCSQVRHGTAIMYGHLPGSHALITNTTCWKGGALHSAATWGPQKRLSQDAQEL